MSTPNANIQSPLGTSASPGARRRLLMDHEVSSDTHELGQSGRVPLPGLGQGRAPDPLMYKEHDNTALEQRLLGASLDPGLTHTSSVASSAHMSPSPGKTLGVDSPHSGGLVSRQKKTPAQMQHEGSYRLSPVVQRGKSPTLSPDPKSPGTGRPSGGKKAKGGNLSLLKTATQTAQRRAMQTSYSMNDGIASRDRSTSDGDDLDLEAHDELFQPPPGPLPSDAAAQLMASPVPVRKKVEAKRKKSSPGGAASSPMGSMASISSMGSGSSPTLIITGPSDQSLTGLSEVSGIGLDDSTSSSKPQLPGIALHRAREYSELRDTLSNLGSSTSSLSMSQLKADIAQAGSASRLGDISKVKSPGAASGSPLKGVSASNTSLISRKSSSRKADSSGTAPPSTGFFSTQPVEDGLMSRAGSYLSVGSRGSARRLGTPGQSKQDEMKALLARDVKTAAYDLENGAPFPVNVDDTVGRLVDSAIIPSKHYPGTFRKYMKHRHSKKIQQDTFWYIHSLLFHEGESEAVQDHLRKSLSSTYVRLFVLLGKKKDFFLHYFPLAIGHGAYLTLLNEFPGSRAMLRDQRVPQRIYEVASELLGGIRLGKYSIDLRIGEVFGDRAKPVLSDQFLDKLTADLENQQQGEGKGTFRSGTFRPGMTNRTQRTTFRDLMTGRSGSNLFSDRSRQSLSEFPAFNDGETDSQSKREQVDTSGIDDTEDSDLLHPPERAATSFGEYSSPFKTSTKALPDRTSFDAYQLTPLTKGYFADMHGADLTASVLGKSKPLVRSKPKKESTLGGVDTYHASPQRSYVRDFLHDRYSSVRDEYLYEGKERYGQLVHDCHRTDLEYKSIVSQGYTGVQLYAVNNLLPNIKRTADAPVARKQDIKAVIDRLNTETRAKKELAVKTAEEEGLSDSRTTSKFLRAKKQGLGFGTAALSSPTNEDPFDLDALSKNRESVSAATSEVLSRRASRSSTRKSLNEIVRNTQRVDTAIPDVASPHLSRGRFQRTPMSKDTRSASAEPRGITSRFLSTPS